MAYIPNPDDATQPTDATVAETMQAEFRALKTKLNGLSTVVNTWNTLDKGTGITCSGGNLIANSTVAGINSVRGTVGKSSGKWYWEVTLNLISATTYIGISKLVEAITNYIGQASTSYSYSSTAFRRNNAIAVAYGATFTTGDVVGVAMDVDNGTIAFYKNGVAQGTAYSAGIAGGLFFPALTLTGLNDSAQVNFGSSNFIYPIPNGFSGFTTASTPAPGIQNLIINGQMNIDQRNAGAAQAPVVTTNYTVDRWKFTASQAGKYNCQQNAGTVTPPPGYINYHGYTVAIAYAVLAGDSFIIEQPIEGLQMIGLDFGKSTAKTVTLMAWVYSSIVGTHSGSLRNAASNRSYPFVFSIATANTWTQIAIVIPGDVTGTWPVTSAASLSVIFSLGVGTTQSGTPGAWAAANYVAATGAVSVVGTIGATFYYTGVELKAGIFAVGSAPERIPYDEELRRCYRYCQVIPTIVEGIGAYQALTLLVTMRIPPSSITGGGAGFTNSGTNTNIGLWYQTARAGQTLTLSAEL